MVSLLGPLTIVIDINIINSIPHKINKLLGAIILFINTKKAFILMNNYIQELCV